MKSYRSTLFFLALLGLVSLLSKQNQTNVQVSNVELNGASPTPHINNQQKVVVTR